MSESKITFRCSHEEEVIRLRQELDELKKTVSGLKENMLVIPPFTNLPPISIDTITVSGVFDGPYYNTTTATLSGCSGTHLTEEPDDS